MSRHLWWMIQNGIHGTTQTEKRKMTWHNLTCLLAQCKSKSNLPWQLQLSWRDPTGISDTLTSQIKPSAWRMCPPWVRDRKYKKKHWRFECLSESWCILMANILGEVLCFTFSLVSHGGRNNNPFKRGLKLNKFLSQTKEWWGRTVFNFYVLILKRPYYACCCCPLL